MSDDGIRDDHEREGELGVKERPRSKKPRMYKVLLHNDDYTTMEFVVWILTDFFHKTRTEATQIMLHVHTKGIGVCGVFTFDMAETKVRLVTDAAKEHGHPFRCTMEPES